MSGAVPERESGPSEHPLHALRIDLERYFPESRPWPWWRRWRRIATSQEIWILVSFRIGSWIRSLPAPWRWFLWLPWAANNRFLTTLLDTHLSIGAQIGPGLHLGHTGGIWINPSARLGACCNVAQGVVIGAAGSSESAPTLGDRVWIGPHAVVTGPIRVGSDVVIGANSLVAAPLADRAVAVGVPARVLTYGGSARLVKVPPTLRQRWQGARSTVQTVPPLSPPRSRPAPAAEPSSEGAGADADRRRDPA